MRVLHTADVHLSPETPEREAALDSVLTLADDESVDIVTIGGDLFDTEVAAEGLRDHLRGLFSDRGYPILTIPGNHDEQAFRSNLVFGENFIPATDTPFDHFIVGDELGRVTYLPYTPQATDELLIALKDREPYNGPEFLLLHCSLEAPVKGGVGEEGEQRYFPISKEQLAELDFDYYLAGHYHTNHRADLSNGGSFIYPGSPASVTRSETGQRTAVLIDTEASQDVQLSQLDTFHYDEKNLRVFPGEEDRIIEDIESKVADWDGRNVDARISVDGYTAWDEESFEDALRNAAGDYYDGDTNDTRTVERILSHPLFEDFQAILEEREEPQATEERDDYELDRFEREVWEQTIEVFATLKAEGTLS